MHTSWFSSWPNTAVLTSYGKGKKNSTSLLQSKNIVYVFHTPKTSNRHHLYGSIMNYKLTTADTSWFLIWFCRWLKFRHKHPGGKQDENKVQIKKEGEAQTTIFLTASSCVIFVCDDKHLFSLQCHSALLFNLRIQGCRHIHPPSQNPALIHFQQILRRLTCPRTSWGFVTVPGRELIS